VKWVIVRLEERVDLFSCSKDGYSRICQLETSPQSGSILLLETIADLV
jgi:hypothetical protein